MAELNELQWEVDGLMLGDGTDLIVTGTDGLEGDATIAGDVTDRAADGVVAGPQRLRDRLVTLTIGLRPGTVADIEAALDDLRAKLAPQADRTGTRLLRWRHRGVTKRLHYLPSAGSSLSVPGGWQELVADHVTATARLWCPDPVAYADTPTATAVSGSSGSPDVVSLANDGTLTAISAGAFTWALTAGSGCSGLFVELVDHPGERWHLVEAVTSGDVVAVDERRVTTNDGVRRNATVKGPAGCPVATWPALRPGANDVRVGCTAGSFTGTLTHRSTW